LISVGDAVLKLGVDTKDLDKGMQNVGNTIKKHQKAIGIAAVAAGGAILAAGALSVKTYAEMGDAVQKMSFKIGFSTEALSEWRHVLEINGTTLETLQKAVKTMSGAIIDADSGLETYLRAFRQIGIEIEDLMGLSPEEQFQMIASAIAELEDETLKMAIATDIFGRGGLELLPTLAQGADGIAALRQEAHDLGIVFDQEAANKAAALTDAMHRMDEATSGVKMAIAEQLIPALMPLIDNITKIIKGITSWTKEHPKLTMVITLGATAFGALLVVLGTFLLLMPGITAATAAFGITLNAAIWPITLIALGIAALIAIGVLLWKNWDTIREKAIMVWNGIVDFFKGIWERITGLFRDHWDKILAILFPAVGIPILIIREWDSIKKFLEKLNPWEWIKAGWDKLREGIKGVLKSIFGGSDIEEWTEGLKNYFASTDLEPTGAQMFETLRAAAENKLDELTWLTKEQIESLKTWLSNQTLPMPSVAMRAGLQYAEMLAQYESGKGTSGYGDLWETPEGREMIAEDIRREQAGQAAYEERLRQERGEGGGYLPGQGPEDWTPGDQPIEEPWRYGGGYIGMQHGGIITRPTLGLLAEAGPEAVIPLNKGGINIFVELDGRIIAQAIGQPLVDEIRLRTGVR